MTPTNPPTQDEARDPVRALQDAIEASIEHGDFLMAYERGPGRDPATMMRNDIGWLLSRLRALSASSSEPDRSTALEGAETAWLIEETWSGYVHYVHRDFDAARWREERDSLDRLPFVWVFNDTGGATLTRCRETIPLITKSADEAMRFETEADALEWLGAQPRWISHGDQFQAREHMWCAPPGSGRPTAEDATPIPMILHCPACGLQHVDAPEPAIGVEPTTSDGGLVPWTNPPHRSHLCHGCGHIWRPADVPTEGVASITTRGKNDSLPPESASGVLDEALGKHVEEMKRLVETDPAFLPADGARRRALATLAASAASGVREQVAPAGVAEFRCPDCGDLHEIERVEARSLGSMRCNCGCDLLAEAIRAAL